MSLSKSIKKKGIMKIEVSEKNVQRCVLFPMPSQCVLFAMKMLRFAKNSISGIIMNLIMELSKWPYRPRQL